MWIVRGTMKAICGSMNVYLVDNKRVHMIKKLKMYGVSVAAVLLIQPAVVLAEEIEKSVATEMSQAFTLLGYYTFWSFLAVALITIGSVFMLGQKMRGGVFQKVLQYFSAGMSVVLIGYLVDLFPPDMSEYYVRAMVDILFMVGFVLMALAGSKLSQAING